MRVVSLVEILQCLLETLAVPGGGYARIVLLLLFEFVLNAAVCRQGFRLRTHVSLQNLIICVLNLVGDPIGRGS